MTMLLFGAIKIQKCLSTVMSRQEEKENPVHGIKTEMHNMQAALQLAEEGADHPVLLQLHGVQGLRIEGHD